MITHNIRSNLQRWFYNLLSEKIKQIKLQANKQTKKQKNPAKTKKKKKKNQTEVTLRDAF